MEHLCKEYYSANATILSSEALEEIRNSYIRSSDPLFHSREVPSDQNSNDNQKFSHNSCFFSSDSIQTLGIRDKKEQVSKIPLSSSLLPIILQDSEDALKVFMKTQNKMKKAVKK
ncbi:2403_t:CDS:2, partial [Funneliformis geosporum]